MATNQPQFLAVGSQRHALPTAPFATAFLDRQVQLCGLKSEMTSTRPRRSARNGPEQGAYRSTAYFDYSRPWPIRGDIFEDSRQPAAPGSASRLHLGR